MAFCESEFTKQHKILINQAQTNKFQHFKTTLQNLTSIPDIQTSSIFQPEGDRGSPFIIAAQKGYKKIFNYIFKTYLEFIDLEYTMKVTSEFTGSEVKGATALWSAALGGHLCIVKELVMAGADINHSNATGSTPLRAASYHNRCEVIRYLLDAGAKCHLSNHVGQAPVMISVLRDNREALAMLATESDANLNQATCVGLDSLHITIERRNDSMFDLMMSLGAKINWPSPCPDQTSYRFPSHVFFACKHDNAHVLNVISSMPECTPQIQSDILLVRGIMKSVYCVQADNQVLWKRALDLRAEYGLPYPGLPAENVYCNVQEIRDLTDLTNINFTHRWYLIQCCLISNRTFGPTFSPSGDFNLKLMDSYFQEGKHMHRHACTLYRRVIDVIVQRPIFPISNSLHEFTVLVKNALKQLDKVSEEVISIEIYAEIFIPLLKRYMALRDALFDNQQLNLEKPFINLMSFSEVWINRLPDRASFSSQTIRDPLLLQTLKTLFYPLCTDKPFYHCIISLLADKAPNLLSTLDYFISISPQDMFEYTDAVGLNALHFACSTATVPSQVIHSLIRHGAHIDVVTPHGKTALELCREKHSQQFIALNSYYPLKLSCIAAHTIGKYDISTATLPNYFKEFLASHRQTTISRFIE